MGAGERPACAASAIIARLPKRTRAQRFWSALVHGERIMTVLRDVGEPGDERTAAVNESAFHILLGEKAWQHLGLTAEEFKRRWYAGEYRDDPRPQIRALDHYMRTGDWAQLRS
jgi:hypothetical protein